MTSGDTVVTYRYLRLAREHELEFDDVRAAFDRACEHLTEEAAAPLEILDARGQVVVSLGELCELSEVWVAWRQGHGSHPLDG
jgi:hypothetical protein